MRAPRSVTDLLTPSPSQQRLDWVFLCMTVPHELVDQGRVLMCNPVPSRTSISNYFQSLRSQHGPHTCEAQQFCQHTASHQVRFLLHCLDLEAAMVSVGYSLSGATNSTVHHHTTPPIFERCPVSHQQATDEKLHMPIAALLH